MSSYEKARRRYRAKQDQDQAEDDEQTPAPPLAQCMAKECPMAAGLSLGGTRRGPQWCAYHHACPADDLARVTSVLNQHKDLRDIINDGRRMISREDANPNTFKAEWSRSIELLRFAAYSDIPKGHDFANFLYLCECMLGQFVVEAMRSRKRAA